MSRIDLARVRLFAAARAASTVFLAGIDELGLLSLRRRGGQNEKKASTTQNCVTPRTFGFQQPSEAAAGSDVSTTPAGRAVPPASMGNPGLCGLEKSIIHSSKKGNTFNGVIDSPALKFPAHDRAGLQLPLCQRHDVVSHALHHALVLSLVPVAVVHVGDPTLAVVL